MHKARDGCEDPPTTVGALHPVIHGQTLKYNMEVKVWYRIFLEELQVGVSAPEELATATQVDAYMPVARDKPSVDLVKVIEEMKSFNASTCGADECASHWC
ncbi:60S ribosomal protein L13-1-like [Solanum pennellii]|uniref:60S ribosomal protein L13-1-like n=1 Tax=Solanum pennellii TaxID=28526 RepID=A0ABM1H093_SOLPN|nr:60S ribosomal protein L13-1-like [Solanum pennellii]